MGKRNTQREPSTNWLAIALYFCIVMGAQVVHDGLSDSDSWTDFVFPVFLIWSLMWAIGQARRILRWELAHRQPTQLTQYINTGVKS